MQRFQQKIISERNLLLYTSTSFSTISQFTLLLQHEYGRKEHGNDRGTAKTWRWQKTNHLGGSFQRWIIYQANTCER